MIELFKFLLVFGQVMYLVLQDVRLQFTARSINFPPRLSKTVKLFELFQTVYFATKSLSFLIIIFIYKFYSSNVGAVLRIKGKVDVVCEQEFHETVLFFGRQITEHKSLLLPFQFILVIVKIFEVWKLGGAETQPRCLLLAHLGRIVVIALITIVNLIVS